MTIKIPNPETIRLSAISNLRELGSHEEAELLSRCKIEISENLQKYVNTTKIGLYFTVRCKASDLGKFEIEDDFVGLMPSPMQMEIQRAIEAVLPVQLKIHELSARSHIVAKLDFDKTELIRLIEAQVDLLIAVATGGPRIQSRNEEYKNRRDVIRQKLNSLSKNDPNPFEDLWAWYGRWSSGDLPSYQSRREYIRELYRPLLQDLMENQNSCPTTPSREPTGWLKVDRTVDKIITRLAQAKDEEDHQGVGLLCRECLISLSQAVYNPTKHKSIDGVTPSKSDAKRMLEAYLSCEFPGEENEALRRHAKAALTLANSLQHKRTAKYKEAALCAEATRTVVNIVAITSEKR
jgi:hypothetical protein